MFQRLQRALALALAALCFHAAASGLDAPETALRALNNGEADKAIGILQHALGANGSDAQAHNLLCRVYFQEERWDEAAAECERAVQLAPRESNYQLWLGRVYGEKADRASFLSGYSLGKKVKSAFEAAASLDPRNAAALSDLGEFYASAPSIIGGGAGKAEATARKLDALDAVRAHELRARIANAAKDTGRAESEFKAAIAASPHPANQWMSLASFYRHSERWDDMVAAVRQGNEADKEHGVAQADGGSILVQAGREPQLAIQMFRSYLASPNKSEEAPAFQIRIKLGKLLEKQGDSAGAKREFQAALALAHDYKPAVRLTTNTGR